MLFTYFFFNYTTTTGVYTYLHTLSLRDALPICAGLGHAHQFDRHHLCTGEHAARRGLAQRERWRQRAESPSPAAARDDRARGHRKRDARTARRLLSLSADRQSVV